MYLFNAGTIVSIFLAAVLAFELAPYLGLASRQAALAIRIGAAVLALEAAWGFLAMPLGSVFYSLPMGGELLQAMPRLLFGGFWACLAWAAFALSQVSPPVRR